MIPLKGVAAASSSASFFAKGFSKMTEQTNRNRTAHLVRMAIFAALTVVLGYFNIPTPFGFEITLASVPVVVGAVFLGTSGGAVLGGVWGLSSFLTCFTGSPMGTILIAANPFYCFLVCVPTRLLVGLLVALLWKWVKKITNRPFSAYLIGAVGPLLNTYLFMSTLFLLFLPEVAAFCGVTIEENVFSTVVALLGIMAGINVIVETVVGCILSGSVIMALWHYEKRR